MQAIAGQRYELQVIPLEEGVGALSCGIHRAILLQRRFAIASLAGLSLDSSPKTYSHLTITKTLLQPL